MYIPKENNGSKVGPGEPRCPDLLTQQTGIVFVVFDFAADWGQSRPTI